MTQLSTSSKRRILVIDDNPHIHEDFRTILLGPIDATRLDALGAELFGDAVRAPSPARFDYQIDYAQQGEEGYEKIIQARTKEQPYSLAFVDMRMPPGWDGLETIEHIWDIDKEIQIVICTAYSDHSWEDITRRLGASDRLLILKKPFDSAEVAQLASALTEKWALGRQAGMKVEELDRLARQRTVELENAIARLSESEERYRSLIEQAHDAFFTHDLDGRFRDVNHRACESLGYTREELLRLSVGDIDQQAEREDHKKKIWPALKAGDPVTFESNHTRKDGFSFPVEIRLGLGDIGGERLFLSQARDISDRKQAEAEHRQLEKHKHQTRKMESLNVMAGAIAHNFNNMLMVIRGNHELARENLPEGSAALSNIEEADKAAARAAELSRLMLTYVGQAKGTMTSLEPDRIVGEATDAIQEIIHAEIEINIDIAKDTPAIQGNADQIREVIVNLLVNSVEAIGSAPGAISIRLSAMECDEHYLQKTTYSNDLSPGVYVSIEIADDGCGMDPATVAKIFDPFFTTKFTGRGLGLAAVLGILRGHGGAINVYSEPNLGSTLRVLLPGIERKRPPRASETEKKDESWTGQGTLLMIDDEEMVRTVAKAMLKHIGFTTIEAANGQEGIDIFREHCRSIDAILLDMNMPGMPGEEVFDEIKKISPDVRIVICSGFTEGQITDKFDERALTGVLQKPFQMSSLRQTMRKVMETKPQSS